MTIDCCAFCDARIFGAQFVCDRCFKRVDGHPQEIRQIMEALTNIICASNSTIIKNPRRYRHVRKCQWCNDTGRLENGIKCSHG